jgi:carbon-monoxide dehydrogenase large subunit
MSKRFVGQSYPRKEDARLLAGAGRYVADIKLPGMLHAAFLRSPVAHGRIRAVGVAQARLLAGVVAVITGADIKGVLHDIEGMQSRPPKLWRDAVPNEVAIPDQPLLASEVVTHVGEAVAVVVAISRYIAEDALDLIDLDIETLPAIATIDAALQPDLPAIHGAGSGNVVAHFRVAKGTPEVDPAGARTIKRRFVNHRYTAMPIECRGSLAQYDPVQDQIMIWSATQVVHWVRREVAVRLDLPEARVRCLAPDVGGGFGVKGHVYPEDIIVPYLARLLNTPVRWIEDRQEHFVNSTHSRDDRHDAEMAFDSTGRVLAVRTSFVKDSGAYSPVGIGTLSNCATHMLGPYDVPSFAAEATLVVTNKTPNAPYRGTGRPEGTFVMERLMDLAADAVGIDPIAIRRLNMIQPEQMPYAVGIPYRDGVPVVYDSGDYPAAFEQALEMLGGLEAFRTEQRAAWRQGRYIGLGIAPYVEGTGAGPFEGATVRIDPSGTIYVATGACAHGQGHETVFSQVAADEWGVTPDRVTMVVSDTAAIANGWGTIASRSGVNSSAAIRKASLVLREKVFKLAGHVLECAESDLELRDGCVGVKGVPGMQMSLKEVAAAARPGWDNNRPPGMSGGLEVTEYFEPPTVTWSYATHAGIVEVMPDTGAVRILRYVVVHDAGTLLNPRIAEGQILGAVCQGIGGALLEEMVYDADGQLLTGSLADYLLPTASDMPAVEQIHKQTPTPLNELGVKGLGEGGVSAPPVIIANGVCDALRPIGIELNATPVRPSDIIKAFARAAARKAGAQSSSSQ